MVTELYRVHGKCRLSVEIQKLKPEVACGRRRTVKTLWSELL